MDQSEVKSIVEDNIERLTKMLGLQSWDINIAYGDCSDNDPALNICDIDYKIIDIVIDSAHIDNKAEVLHTLRHELVHALISTFGTYRLAVNCFLAEKECDSTSIMFRRAEEESVIAFVRVLERVEDEDETM